MEEGATVVAVVVVAAVGTAVEESVVAAVMAVVQLHRWKGVVEWEVVSQVGDVIALRIGLVFWVWFVVQR